MLSLPNIVQACRFALEDVDVKWHKESLVEPGGFEPPTFPVLPGRAKQLFIGGAGGIRTPDLLDAIEARSQLRHGPTGCGNAKKL
jgi:hypothetical protein